MGKSLFCRLCNFSAFKILTGRPCEDCDKNTKENTDCPEGNVAKKMNELLEAVNSSNSQTPILEAVGKVINDDVNCYDKNFIKFCKKMLRGIQMLYQDPHPHEKMYIIVNGGEWEEPNKDPNKPPKKVTFSRLEGKEREIVETIFKLSSKYRGEYLKYLNEGGKRRRRRKSRRKSRKSRRKSRKTKRKRRKSRKTKKRRRRRR